MSRPIFRVGLSALRAYCGMSETSRKRKRFIPASSSIGSSAPSSSTRPPTWLHPAVEADEALRERRLAAAGLAGEPGDLAVRDRERDAVDGVHVAVQRPVVHAQVVDAQAHVRRSLGLKISSRPTFVT